MRRFLVGLSAMAVDALDEYETRDVHRTYFGQNPIVTFEICDQEKVAEVETKIRVGREVFPFKSHVPKVRLQEMNEAYREKHGTYPPLLVKQRFMIWKRHVFLDWYEFPEETHVLVLNGDLSPTDVQDILPEGIEVLEEVTDEVAFREENMAGQVA